ncbi:MAG: succinate dehydrogenase cytochrome b subunit [Chitinophagaceae bacterium]
MKWSQVFASSVGRKFIMAFTGLFLIIFLVVHCYVNLNVLFENGEENFNRAANFMSTNILVRIMEIGLFAGFILHIFQGFTLELKNRASRKTKYAIDAPSKTSSWYSRSMALLGTLILLFLIIHLGNFWVPSRFGHLESVTYGEVETHNLYAQMQLVFSNIWLVILYVLGCFSLSWHLLHGFQSAFQTLGWKQTKYKVLIENIGIGFSIIVPFLFALMPIFMHWGITISIGNLTFLF